jgi:hypothetical protein
MKELKRLNTTTIKHEKYEPEDQRAVPRKSEQTDRALPEKRPLLATRQRRKNGT